MTYPRTGRGLVQVLRTRRGQKYRWGAIAPYRDPNYAGPWDCAELVTWGVCQVTGELYGCSNGNAYSGAWVKLAQDLPECQITLGAAPWICGAILIRTPLGESRGHVAVSQGDGFSLEAYSSQRGVIETTLAGRRWDAAMLLPDLQYDPIQPAPLFLRRGHANPSATRDLQTLLNRVLPVDLDVDGDFGAQTQAAVLRYQKANRLLPDGEVGLQTWHTLRWAADP